MFDETMPPGYPLETTWSDLKLDRLHPRRRSQQHLFPFRLQILEPVLELDLSFA